MARTNYGFEKRQRELAKKQKKEAKRLKKVTTQPPSAAQPNPTSAPDSLPAEGVKNS